MDNTKKVLVNPSRALLVERIVKSGEGELLANGTVNVNTAPYTGRSPKDKFFVEDDLTKDNINWGKINQPFSKGKFEVLKSELKEYLDSKKETYLLYGYAGVEDKYRIKVSLLTDSAVNALTFKNLVLNSEEEFEPDLKLYASTDFAANPEKHGTNSEAFVVLDMTSNEIIIGNTKYAGEIKKSIFSYVNFVLPLKGIFSMHCSANTALDGTNPALFFGLSGTGKTTLSLDEKRLMIGDDEHGWHEEGIFNVEGGSYAKIIGVSETENPEIFNTLKFGVHTENVVFDPETRIPDYDDKAITENTRATIPLSYFDGIKKDSKASHPKNIFFLSADALGILPPISKLDDTQIFNYFMLGYTCKLAGTERGIVSPLKTFSEGFAKPFLPLRPEVYANMLVEKVKEHGSNVYLVNTGWIGGPYGTGSRIKLRYTKRLVDAAVNGEYKNFVEFNQLNLLIPTECEGVPSEILNPKNTWENKEEYDKKAKELSDSFQEYFAKLK